MIFTPQLLPVKKKNFRKRKKPAQGGDGFLKRGIVSVYVIR
jgi:hypothetical protein